MVLTSAQTTLFFENALLMGIPHTPLVGLAAEGIYSVDDIVDFNIETLQIVANSLRRPGGSVKNTVAGSVVGATITTPPFVFGAKSQKLLLTTCDIVP